MAVDVEKDSASVVAMWFSMVVILLFFAAIFSVGKIFVMIVPYVVAFSRMFFTSCKISSGPPQLYFLVNDMTN